MPTTIIFMLKKGEQKMKMQKTESTFSQSLSTIFVGIVATCLQVSIWNLNYILPFFGYLLLLTELRLLKRENKFLNYCFLLNLFRLFFLIKTIVLNGSLLKTLYLSNSPYLVFLFDVVDLVLLVLFLFFFQKGLMQIQKKQIQHIN